MQSESRDGKRTPLALSAFQCKDCATECRQPFCPTVELTAQCTDQCVVIACHDLTHDEALWPGTGLEEACDLVRHGLADCTDCTRYEDLLQCCTDYQSYSSQSKSSSDPEPSTEPWNFSLGSFLCDCTEHELSKSHDNVFDTVWTTSQSNDDVFMSSPHPMAVNVRFPSKTHSSTDHPPTFISRESAGISDPSQVVNHALLSCMWGDCHEPFSNRQELATHVNSIHLRPFSEFRSNVSVETPSLLQVHPQDDTTFDFSCHWADCDQYSSPDVALDPIGNQRDAALEVLAHHLLQDHLGLLSGLPSLPEGVPTKEANEEGDTTGSIPTPPVSPPPTSGENQVGLQHDCAGTHACHWESCTGVFSSCDELTTHITTLHVGTGKAHYDCLWKNCNRHGDRGFSSKQKICRHLQSHTGHRPFQCEKCKHYFSEAATLQQHMRRHTQEKPYICDFPGCGKAFSIMGALTIHTRKHNGLKPFKCRYCDRAFAESSNLSKHLRTHTGDRPYPCTIGGCGKSFARPDQLTRHMGVHKKKSNLAERVGG